MTCPLILKLEDWPDPDRATWFGLFKEGGLLDDAGPCRHWSNGSRSKRRQSYGHWLGYLRNHDRLDPASAPAERFTPELLDAFLEDTRSRVSLKSTAMQAEDLYVLATLFGPDRDWAWFRAAKDWLRHRAGSSWQLKPRPGVSAGEVYDWALSEMIAADAMPDTGGWRKPVRFRDGLMVGLLIARPLRPRAFMAIEIGRHLVEEHGGFVLRFAPEDMKDRRVREFAFPKDLVDPVRRYLGVHRPALLQGEQTSRLWVSRRAGPLSRDGFYRHLLKITGEAFGEELYPHRFRHVAATSIAEEDPKRVNIIASVLGHSTLEMSERHYNLASGVRAAASWQETVRERRLEARRKARRTRRLSPQASVDDDASEA